MNNAHKIGLGLCALVVARVAARDAARSAPPSRPAGRRGRSDAGSPRVDAGARGATSIMPRLDQRLQQLIAKPAMVGLAVGVVENGRITFLKGYGETHAGSGEPVTPDTVFRWASVSKGVAATMVAKLAEEGKIDLNAPVVNYAPDLKLPAGNEYRATVADLLSHRLGLYRNAYDNKLEEGMDPSMLRRSLVQLNAICPPGHLLVVPECRL